MRINLRSILALAGAAGLAACAHGGVRHGNSPDEFAVQRQAPLSVPPGGCRTISFNRLAVSR